MQRYPGQTGEAGLRQNKPRTTKNKLNKFNLKKINKMELKGSCITLWFRGKQKFYLSPDGGGAQKESSCDHRRTGSSGQTAGTRPGQ